MSKHRLSQGLKRAQSRLLNQNSKKILNSVFLLYVVLFASIIDLLYMVSIGVHSNIIIFFMVAYVTSMFSKNMTVILIIALAITNIYHLGRDIILKEGFEEGAADETNGDDNDIESKDKESEDKESEDKESEDKESEDKESKDKESNDKEKDKKEGMGQLPKEYIETLKQLRDPETMRTIEGLKSLEPLAKRMEGLARMFK